MLDYQCTEATDTRETTMAERAKSDPDGSERYIVRDDGCNILWWGNDQARAEEMAEEIEHEHNRGVYVIHDPGESEWRRGIQDVGPCS
jgi:hypothetical protein